MDVLKLIDYINIIEALSEYLCRFLDISNLLLLWMVLIPFLFHELMVSDEMIIYGITRGRGFNLIN